MLHLSTRSLFFTLTFLAGGLLLAFLYWQSANSAPEPRTIEVARGDVIRGISASGSTESNTTAALGFPLAGTIASIAVQEGDTVTAGQTLATLRTDSIDAEISEAQAALTEALARQQELLAGSTEAARAVSSVSVANATQALDRTRTTQEQLVQTARETLLSSDLATVAVDPEETATAPTVSGTYQCEETGSYELQVFRSNADSQYSVRVTGLETDTVPVSFTQPVPFGDCGLRLQFTADVRYGDTTWRLLVPNQNAASYITNRNRYETAQTNASSAIAAAEDALALAEQQAAEVAAPTRTEQIEQSNARVAQADARLTRLQRRRADHTLTAPTNGAITAIDATVGETADRPFITFLGTTDSFELKARIAEVDITYIEPGDPVVIEFDARPTEQYRGMVDRISPLPTQIEGVAYFTATIAFADPPNWLRSGLNADIEIITEQRVDTPRIPQGFIYDLTGPAPYVQIWEAIDRTSTTTIQVDLVGTDGMAAVIDLPLGTTIIAP